MQHIFLWHADILEQLTETNVMKILPYFKNLNKNLLLTHNSKQDCSRSFTPSLPLFSSIPLPIFSTLFTTPFLQLNIISHRTVGHRQASSYLRCETDPVLKVPDLLSFSQNPQPDPAVCGGAANRQRPRIVVLVPLTRHWDRCCA